jgi:hypothetical protein
MSHLPLRYGQILLVKQSSGLKLEQWKSWIWLIMHTFVLWLVLSQITGPVSAIAVCPLAQCFVSCAPSHCHVRAILYIALSCACDIVHNSTV